MSDIEYLKKLIVRDPDNWSTEGFQSHGCVVVSVIREPSSQMPFSHVISVVEMPVKFFYSWSYQEWEDRAVHPWDFGVDGEWGWGPKRVYPRTTTYYE